MSIWKLDSALDCRNFLRELRMESPTGVVSLDDIAKANGEPPVAELSDIEVVAIANKIADTMERKSHLKRLH